MSTAAAEPFMLTGDGRAEVTSRRSREHTGM